MNPLRALLRSAMNCILGHSHGNTKAYCSANLDRSQELPTVDCKQWVIGLVRMPAFTLRTDRMVALDSATSACCAYGWTST